MVTPLNTTNWTALNRQDSFNNEKQYYWPGQVTVANGNLQLTAINQPRRRKAIPIRFDHIQLALWSRPVRSTN